MVNKISSGIEIRVKPAYEPTMSEPATGSFLFSYHIDMINHNDFTVQLISRHWYIFDSLGMYREVEGDGVVGLQPILEPGDNYDYSSACHLHSEIGRMHGYFTFNDYYAERSFKVEIPAFDMVAPVKLN